MKFSASFVVLAFIFSKTAFAFPVVRLFFFGWNYVMNIFPPWASDAYDLVEHDFEGYSLETCEFYENAYEERSFDGDELFERDLSHDELEVLCKYETWILDARGKANLNHILTMTLTLTTPMILSPPAAAKPAPA
ncbi:hypothetical protein P691DRAFT_764212 [Macrolepiota fuliginosa MF-IS2]|uniref:Uncharacterized protein n=1 Tax=Macrolepiota fuliginosa MF-IS2 TaxID=1400762 RepID=A0A9P5X505_9AGAR|nr:hypothetical protein P691DRAFT_764212 [Macrolepiota fuliginosa MF-IS2]